MAANSRARQKRKKPIGFGVFCEFILIFVLILTLLFICVVYIDPVWNFISGNATLSRYVVRIGEILQSKILDACQLDVSGIAVFAADPTWSAYAVSSVVFVIAAVGFVFSYFPWMAIGHNRLRNKRGQGWRAIVEIINWLICMAFVAGCFSLMLSRYSKTSEMFAWAEDIFTKISEIFGLSRPWCILILYFAVLLLDLILVIVGTAGGEKEKKQAPVNENQTVNRYRTIPCAEISPEENY